MSTETAVGPTLSEKHSKSGRTWRSGWTCRSSCDGLLRGCTSESHQIYATFMDSLSHCIFKWDEEDLKQLKEAKHTELSSEIIQPSDDELIHHLSRNELALHCRRTTCGAREIEELIAALIRLYDGEVGWDSSGVPLFSYNTMAEVWDSQKKHLPCIVDPLGVQLYEQTGTLVKGGHLLPNYKCVRGSTSIESFHQHLNQLIPGVPTCSTLLQIDCWMDWSGGMKRLLQPQRACRHLRLAWGFFSKLSTSSERKCLKRTLCLLSVQVNTQ
ncbi:uncharacterized protein, partial [Sinocyclocheilus grahami]|uniref:uncharacterized protein n=1 Tax=Sinocyclocheilus grahami TaxID=75366 RepID=UPI0007ACB2B7